jgi:hypothetical protein
LAKASSRAVEISDTIGGVYTPNSCHAAVYAYLVLEQISLAELERLALSHQA